VKRVIAAISLIPSREVMRDAEIARVILPVFED
jgi:hypothetical protein